MDNSKSFADFDLYCVQVMSFFLRQRAPVEDIDEVIEYLRKLKLEHYGLLEKIKMLEDKVNIDLKTGLLKYNEEYIENIMKIASRALDGSSGEYNLSYVRFDIDDFSTFNNKYGHDVGDAVLVEVSTAIKDCTRPTDYAIRFGGEEFDLLLPFTNIKGAEGVASKVFDKIKEINIKEKDEQLKITVSAGISSTSLELTELTSMSKDDYKALYHEIQRESDNALYDAKFQGKNQFCKYDISRREEYVKIRKKYVEKG